NGGMPHLALELFKSLGSAAPGLTRIANYDRSEDAGRSVAAARATASLAGRGADPHSARDHYLAHRQWTGRLAAHLYRAGADSHRSGRIPHLDGGGSNAYGVVSNGAVDVQLWLHDLQAAPGLPGQGRAASAS